MNITLLQGDCVQRMSEMEPDSIASIVCDPPYGLEFMGEEFDSLGDAQSQQKWHAEWLRQSFRVLMPGGRIYAFGGTRVYHRMAAAFDDAGFVNIGIAAWAYGSGFPKPTHNIAIVLDKQAGVLKQRGRGIPVAGRFQAGTGKNSASSGEPLKSFAVPPYVPISPNAIQWNGWGTNLKPAWEPFVVGEKPGTVTGGRI